MTFLIRIWQTSEEPDLCLHLKKQTGLDLKKRILQNRVVL